MPKQGFDREVTKVFVCKKGFMSPSLLHEDQSAKHVLQTLKQFARWSGVGGVRLAMALSRIFTSSPIQLYKIRGILCANRAPALVHEQLAVV
jgi:hypothetical protein